MTVNAVVSEVTEVADALIATVPARAPVRVLEATPPEAVTAPRPVTVPAPLVFAKVTEMVSLVTRLPPASRLSTVAMLVLLEATSAADEVEAGRSAAPAPTADDV